MLHAQDIFIHVAVLPDERQTAGGQKERASGIKLPQQRNVCICQTLCCCSVLLDAYLHGASVRITPLRKQVKPVLLHTAGKQARHYRRVFHQRDKLLPAFRTRKGLSEVEKKIILRTLRNDTRPTLRQGFLRLHILGGHHQIRAAAADAVAQHLHGDNIAAQEDKPAKTQKQHHKQSRQRAGNAHQPAVYRIPHQIRQDEQC